MRATGLGSSFGPPARRVATPLGPVLLMHPAKRASSAVAAVDLHDERFYIVHYVLQDGGCAPPAKRTMVSRRLAAMMSARDLARIAGLGAELHYAALARLACEERCARTELI